MDPPRPEVHPALEKARHAHIRTIMITGDYPNTARAVAESIGLLRQGHKVMTGVRNRPAHDEQRREEVSAPTYLPGVSPAQSCASWTRCATQWRSGSNDRAMV